MKKNYSFPIQFNITNRCNLSCKYCFKEEQNIQQIPQIKLLKRIVKKYVLLCKKNSLHSSLIVSGGEIFLENYLFELIKFYKKISQNSPIYLLTNGTLINDKLAHRLKNLNINGIQVSLDGHTEDIHEFNRNSKSFRATIMGIKNLVKYDIKFSVNCILNTRINSHLEDIFVFCKNLDVKELNFDRLLPVKQELKKYLLSTNELKDKYYEILNLASKYNLITNTKGPLWCLIDKRLGSKDMTGIWGLTVDFNGTVYPASRLNIPIGNIFKNDLVEILINSETMKLLREHEIEICSDCDYFSTCRGNRILSYYYYGEFHKRDPQCWN